jgi:hypothetical protein
MPWSVSEVGSWYRLIAWEKMPNSPCMYVINTPKFTKVYANTICNILELMGGQPSIWEIQDNKPLDGMASKWKKCMCVNESESMTLWKKNKLVMSIVIYYGSKRLPQHWFLSAFLIMSIFKIKSRVNKWGVAWQIV